jgi:transcription antitermination factor NusG
VITLSYQWYALHVRRRFEKYVANQLSDKGYETFVPTYVNRRKWSDREKSLTLPLFPSYVFCRFNIHARLPVLTTPGVNCVLGVGRTPTPVDENEIASLRQVILSGAPTQPSPYVSVGELVHVEDGPLKGLAGIVVRVRGGHRLIVSVSLLMRSIAVEIDRRQVRSVGLPPVTESIVRAPKTPMSEIPISRVR